MAASSSRGGSSSSRGNSAKAMVADQISQAVQSTSNLLHLMQQSSHSQALSLSLSLSLSIFYFLFECFALILYHKQRQYRSFKWTMVIWAQLAKLPKDLLAKTSTIKNTGQLLEQMPRLISSLDAHMESGLQRLYSSGLHLLLFLIYKLLSNCLQIWKAASSVLSLKLPAFKRNMSRRTNLLKWANFPYFAAVLLSI
ncbi:hypothetical protein FEM48_Zijuj11G0081600 [Ziziphus jujuba var. spinosa]|uniref:Uncharacterized protein n=1 Tax=Ziziphus jujuba var. spinosa TaxID=714518 RepID=A0A978UHT1_ZIZJJ|nr:hypothetical protein FEM48_Zijuj11G0081600 [Ziziphus jujuba var. spinosa]